MISLSSPDVTAVPNLIRSNKYEESKRGQIVLPIEQVGFCCFLPVEFIFPEKLVTTYQTKWRRNQKNKIQVFTAVKTIKSHNEREY
jgi:hypothetical protein